MEQQKDQNLNLKKGYRYTNNQSKMTPNLENPYNQNSSKFEFLPELN